jgi:peptide chain release factor 2
LDKKQEQIIELEKEVQNPNLWDNQERATELTQKLSDLSDEIKQWSNIESQVQNNLEIATDLSTEADEEIEKELQTNLNKLKQKFSELEFFVFFQGRFDSNSAIISISAGAGGTDAQDWAEMLESMLLKYSNKHGFKTNIVERQKGQEAGIKSSTFEVQGLRAYGWLKSESGVHRLVRISPFDAEKMRHTSFALVDVIPDLGDTKDIEIKEEDIRVDVFRASGNGGQSVNTTDSAVRIVHEPSGIVVTCQNERSQQQNKQTAMKILKSRLAKKQEEDREKEERKIRGDVKSAEWGSQIRSYVLHPYKMIKDHRTEIETSDVDSVLDGSLDKFSESYIKWIFKQK